MKKGFIIILIIYISLLSGCGSYKDSLQIFYDEVTTLNIGESLSLSSTVNNEEVTWISDNQEVINVEENLLTAKKAGFANVSATVNDEVVLTKTFVVKDEAINIVIEGESNIKVGENIRLNATVNPILIDQRVTWDSSDPQVATVDDDGNVRAINKGITIITATSVASPQVMQTKVINVTDDEEDIEIDKLIFEFKEQNKEIDLLAYKRLFEPIIANASSSVVGVSNYINSSTPTNIGSGVIYKRNAILKNGDIVNDDLINLDDIEEYEYWVITNRHVIANHRSISIYYQKDKAEIPAELIQYDDKEDLAVLKFISKIYFPIAKFATTVETGDFVIAIGHSEGYDFFGSATFGIVSHPERYLSTDTNNDNLNDWDALYIQHDAPINEGNSGGPLINLKGEVVGINTIKQGNIFQNIDNICFAIPTSLTMDIVSLLEQGIRPKRVILGVEVISVKDILANPNPYPHVKIPEGLTYGFYINKVNTGGLADQAGILPNDILIEYNGKKMRKSSELRAEINRYVIGSGETVEVVVIRNHQEMKLYLTY